MKYIFITGMGRSGTMLVSKLLETQSNCTVCHEYINNREFWLLSWYLPEETYAVPYLNRVQSQIERDYSTEFFVDVNSFLQNSVGALRKVFNPKDIIHLVRDGREVVRSIYPRRTENDIQKIPRSREAVEKWLEMDKFDRVCFNWADTTMRLIQEGTTLVRFEELLLSYDYFDKRLLSPFGFKLAEDAWIKLVKKKVNKTRSKTYRRFSALLRNKNHLAQDMPHYDHWTERQKERFWEICGDAMREAGYHEEG